MEGKTVGLALMSTLGHTHLLVTIVKSYLERWKMYNHGNTFIDCNKRILDSIIGRRSRLELG
jgi:hypothetical protein